jgi:GTP-binding protein HflX
MKKKLHGNVAGLRNTQIKRIETLYDFTTYPEFIAEPELAHLLVDLSHEIRRQIGILIDRNGKVIYAIVGDAQRIVIPITTGYMAIPGRLKGLRLFHTHLKNEALTRDDLTDLALLRLDYITAIGITQDGTPGQVYSAHILPDEDSEPYQTLEPCTINELDNDCLDHVLALESELTQKNSLHKPGSGKENAFLINATTLNPRDAWASMDELQELCKTSRVNVIGKEIQRRKAIDTKFVVGKGKLSDIIIKAIQKYATLLVFDRELSASQIRSITDFVEMKVIDRTQLILDIFAKQAKSREGKYQVELAQMEYILPRLITKNTAMSRLTGGIGGRGPGETKLELNRRRIRDRITRLKKEIKNIRKQRYQQKARRKRKDLPVISIVGYTNAGKSTLLNTLTQSKIIAANRLFATLDPSSRRLRFPRDTEVIITDTVGFIQNLPKELMEAFHATLEELAEADIILHVIDVSNPRYQQQKDSVEKILKDLKLDRIPTIYVFNKIDRIDIEAFDDQWLLKQGVMVSATKKQSLNALVEQLESIVGPEKMGSPEKMDDEIDIDQ